MIVTPSDNRSTVSDLSKDDYVEYESRISQRVPPVPEAGVPLDSQRFQQHYPPRAGFGPRLGHYDSYPEVQHTELAGYKHIPYAERMHGEYTPLRNFIEPGGSPPPSVTTSEYPTHRSQHQVHNQLYAPERRVLHSRGAPGGYWVREWLSPSTRRADEYAGWR